MNCRSWSCFQKSPDQPEACTLMISKSVIRNHQQSVTPTLTNELAAGLTKPPSSPTSFSLRCTRPRVFLVGKSLGSNPESMPQPWGLWWPCFSIDLPPPSVRSESAYRFEAWGLGLGLGNCMGSWRAVLKPLTDAGDISERPG